MHTLFAAPLPTLGPDWLDPEYLINGFVDSLGAWVLLGRKAGPRIFNRPDSRLFKQEYFDKTPAFFEKYRGRAIVAARLVPSGGVSHRQDGLRLAPQVLRGAAQEALAARRS